MAMTGTNWMRYGLAPVVLLAALLGGCSGGETPPAEIAETVDLANRPNIVLISVDTLRPDRLACYGHDRPTSPNIDRLAREGTLFENVVSSTCWTLPAHSAMFTGLVDSVHGCLDTDTRLDDSRNTLAERLAAAGYGTVGIYSGPSLHPVFGLSQGFETYVDCTGLAGLTLNALRAGEQMDSDAMQQASALTITNPTVRSATRDWLRQKNKKPFFMFIHMWDVHFFYIPPPPYNDFFDPGYQGSMDGRNFFAGGLNPGIPEADLEHVLSQYDGEIAWTDMFLGFILGELRRHGLEESTVVMLLSDHGEEFYEHGLRGHRLALFEESIRIPLIVRWPGHVPAGRQLVDQVAMVDIMPTLLDLAGVPAGNDVMGRSLVPLFEGNTLPEGPAAVSELLSQGQQLCSFRRNDRKMIANVAIQRQIFIDLVDDPGEQQVISDPNHPAINLLARDMQQAMGWVERYRQALPVEKSPPELPDDLRRHLVELGYLEEE
jgi:arylsulfatase A-like enzyme